jgi:hypothetical protein
MRNIGFKGPRWIKRTAPAIWYYVNRKSVDVYVSKLGDETRSFRLTRVRLQRMLADLPDAPKDHL